jgi:hypothetical protein
LSGIKKALFVILSIVLCIAALLAYGYYLDSRVSTFESGDTTISFENIEYSPGDVAHIEVKVTRGIAVRIEIINLTSSSIEGLENLTPVDKGYTSFPDTMTYEHGKVASTQEHVDIVMPYEASMDEVIKAEIEVRYVYAFEMYYPHYSINRKTDTVMIEIKIEK